MNTSIDELFKALRFALLSFNGPKPLRGGCEVHLEAEGRGWGEYAMFKNGITKRIRYKGAGPNKQKI